MANIELLVGTTLGNAEYVADELASLLENAGHKAQVHLTPRFDELDPKALWLVISSTHGAGDLPDNIQPFFEDLANIKPDLTLQKFALCAIGDSQYDTFCQGPEKLNYQLIALGAFPIFDKLKIDVQSTPNAEDPAINWISNWMDLI